MNYNRNKRYFFPRKYSTGMLFLLGGISTILIGLNYGIAFSLILGAVLLVIGVIGIILAISTNSIPDSSLDEQRDAYAADAVERAKKYFKLEQAEYAREPITLTSYHYATKDAAALVRIGRDDVPRSNACLTVVLLFTQDRLYWYDSKFSLVFMGDEVETGDSMPYTAIQNVVAEAAKRNCDVTPRFKTISVNMKHLKVEGSAKTFDAYLVSPNTDETVAIIKDIVKDCKKKSSKKSS